MPRKNLPPQKKMTTVAKSVFLSPASPTHRVCCLAMAHSFRQAQAQTQSTGITMKLCGILSHRTLNQEAVTTGEEIPNMNASTPPLSKKPTWLPAHPVECGAVELPEPWFAKKCQEQCSTAATIPRSDSGWQAAEITKLLCLTGLNELSCRECERKVK